ncbi:MAG: hypothetical protein COA78_22685 [Blastopirellula sp.]|nr:MAG: hypothetical protein COA78_22685 [Blastopirellula sp.]
MPFTPFHMGPGLLIKALLQGSFSLMVFGWAQIVMDIQPLVAMITGEGRLHGFSHTYLGATLLAVFAAVSGKYLSERGFRILGMHHQGQQITIAWSIASVSALIGTFSHVVIDSMMHRDMEPWFPWTASNPMLGIIDVGQLHQLCMCSGIVGAALYFLVYHFNKQPSVPPNSNPQPEADQDETV